MTPFSLYLQQLRTRQNLRQTELAQVLGYDQSYISALEVGIKGPPTDEFISRLITAFSITADEENRLREAISASQRKIVLDRDLPIDIYWLFKDFRERASQLSRSQVNIIKETLKLQGQHPEMCEQSASRKIKRRKEESKM